MRRYVRVATAIAAAFVLLVAMARASGFLLLPLVLALVLGLGYVAVRSATGTPSPYPRIASGVFERSDAEAIRLSETDVCESCADWEGTGERRVTHREFVFLGVPLVRLSTTRTVRCEVCADPVAALECRERDAVDRELERGR
ncbi:MULTISPECIES: hypothetical protein [Halorussus]|uniref:hypothetical protein n=1 Tax=Halorussus TaxID=1070314 RepID=UPI0020A21018|nr:hypothetical protein [Halorussus vallis]USZ76506.1 hypothetical protein NGM07_04065 [Halorussus vallis]